MIIQGDVVEVLKAYEDNSFDAVLCDPPYGLSFMGKKWDYQVPNAELWREVLRVCKPGAPLIAFSGTRTYHRTVVQIEDAGWEIRDQLAWMYGSGFPKSLDVSKAIDAAAGAVREVVGERKKLQSYGCEVNNVYGGGPDKGGIQQITAPATDAARLWHGYGTALKPAFEPAVLARKPLEGTVAQNVAKWGVGALAIDACRIETVEALVRPQGQPVNCMGARTEGSGRTKEPQGRWPANVILDEEAGKILDEQSGFTKSSDAIRNNGGYTGLTGGSAFKEGPRKGKGHSDSGGASRFFYCAKVGKKERGAGNNHPTLKPLALMEYLARLILPPSPGKILVPFAGAGSEMIGAYRAGWRDIVGIEREEAYVKIAMSRLAKEGIE